MRRLVALALLVLAPALVVVADDEMKGEKKGTDEARSAPAFTLKDLKGKEHSLAQYKDKIVVLEWTEPGCPYIVRHAKEKTLETIQKDYKDKDVVVLGICTSRITDTEGMASFAKEHGISYSVLMDTDGAIGRAYGASNTPHLFVVKDGKIVYEGAIDDDPRGQKGKDATNYVRAAIDDLLAGKSVATAKTKPYG